MVATLSHENFSVTIKLYIDFPFFSPLVRTSYTVLPHWAIKSKGESGTVARIYWLCHRDYLWLQLSAFYKIINNKITFLLFRLFATNPPLPPYLGKWSPFSLSLATWPNFIITHGLLNQTQLIRVLRECYL